MENEKEISKLELEIADIEDLRRNFERKVQKASGGYYFSILVLLVGVILIFTRFWWLGFILLIPSVTFFVVRNRHLKEANKLIDESYEILKKKRTEIVELKNKES